MQIEIIVLGLLGVLATASPMASQGNIVRPLSFKYNIYHIILIRAATHNV